MTLIIASADIRLWSEPAAAGAQGG
jgi:hypothetical protein